MRKIYLLMFIVFLGTISCKKQVFLDDKTSSLIDINAVFSDSTRTMAFLTRMYEDIGFNFFKGRWEGGNTEQSGDDAEFTLSNPARRPVALYLGAYGPEQFVHTDAWDLPWINIRRANLLMSRLATTPLSAALQSRVRGEAKFMRAYFYGYMLINFGGMPIIGDSIFTKDDNINLPRSSFDDCVKYVVKEYDEAAALLPQVYPNDIDYGRVTKGACMGMKARLLLHAASPLFNGGAISGATEEQKKVAGYPVYDVNKWQIAADAANAVMQSGYYSLNEDNSVKPGFGFYNLFLQRVNKEYILFVNRPPNRDMEAHYLPSSRGGANNSRPTQNLVDCFPMKNGKLITDPTSGYNPANPYVNRDPRFNYTIIYNGSRYGILNSVAPILDTVFTYIDLTTPFAPNKTGDAYNPNPVSVTLTGYYGRKMCDSTIPNNGTANTLRGWPLLRYAEIVLSYAEAINETGQTAKAYQPMIDLRRRAGIDAGSDGLYGLKPNMTVAEMRDIIRNDRHVELVFEGDTRWNDICRWKIAEIVNNGKLRVMGIRRDAATKAYTYTEGVGLVAHAFTPKQYLFPIPGIEIRKMPLMIQNPGW